MYKVTNTENNVLIASYVFTLCAMVFCGVSILISLFASSTLSETEFINRGNILKIIFLIIILITEIFIITASSSSMIAAILLYRRNKINKINKMTHEFCNNFDREFHMDYLSTNIMISIVLCFCHIFIALSACILSYGLILICVNILVAITALILILLQLILINGLHTLNHSSSVNTTHI